MTLITDAYRALITQLHDEREDWGMVGAGFAPVVLALCERAGVKECLDYGCGKQRLRDALAPDGITVHGYDPAIAEVSAPPEPHDVVVSFDVLEHIEPECLDEVLADMKRVTRKFGCFTIATRPAKKILADGRNAHLIVEPAEWWLKRLHPYFRLVAEPQGTIAQFMVFVTPR